jgi:putative ABC transport system permease protein
VVGVTAKKSSVEMGDNPEAKLFVPFTTFQKAFNSLNTVHWFSIVAEPGEDVARIEKDIKRLMSRKHKVDPTDDNAFGSWNMQDMYGKMSMLFVVIAGISCSWACSP